MELGSREYPSALPLLFLTAAFSYLSLSRTVLKAWNHANLSYVSRTLFLPPRSSYTEPPSSSSSRLERQ
jgi:hypothetical protein